MKCRWLFGLIVISLFSLLVGCNNEGNSKETKSGEDVAEETAFLYENEEAGIAIKENSDWKLDAEKEAMGLNVTLSHSNVNAIVTTVSEDKSFEEIKAELKVASGDIEVISEEGNTLSYKSKLKNAIRTDVYFKEHGSSNNLVIIFMSPVAEYEQAATHIESLLNHITLN